MRLGTAFLLSLFAHAGMLALTQTPGANTTLRVTANVSGSTGPDRFGKALQVTMGVASSISARIEGFSNGPRQAQTARDGAGASSNVSIDNLDANASGGRLAPTSSGIPMALPGNVYFRVSELDERPQIQTQTEPQFPLHVDPGVVGAVVLKLLIDQSGAVEEAIVVSSKPEGVFDAAAVAEFRKARFLPGRKAGKAVKTQLAVEVVFESRPFRE